MAAELTKLFGPGTVSVSGSTFTGNSATDNGGGIFNQGTLTVSGSILSGNSAGIGGGGIWIGYYAAATVSSSTVSGNSAAQGGGIWNWRNVVTVENLSSINGNIAPIGFWRRRLQPRRSGLGRQQQHRHPRCLTHDRLKFCFESENLN